jgi:hypothetical protein
VPGSIRFRGESRRDGTSRLMPCHSRTEFPRRFFELPWAVFVAT